MAETLSGDEQFPVIARFEIRRRAYLAPDGTGLRRLPSFAYDIPLLVSFLRAMVPPAGASGYWGSSAMAGRRIAGRTVVNRTRCAVSAPHPGGRPSPSRRAQPKRTPLLCAVDRDRAEPADRPTGSGRAKRTDPCAS